MIKTSSWSGGTDEEYETQHFGFGAQRLKISVHQMVEEKLVTAVKDMESFLQQSLDLNDKDKGTLTHCCDKILRLYCERAEKSLGVIDNEIERILKVPSNVLLTGDEIHEQGSEDVDLEKLKDEVNGLRKQVERGALMEALLTAEEEELSSVEHICETAKKDMEAFDKISKDVEDLNNIKNALLDVKSLCTNVPLTNRCDKILTDD